MMRRFPWQKISILNTIVPTEMTTQGLVFLIGFVLFTLANSFVISSVRPSLACSTTTIRTRVTPRARAVVPHKRRAIALHSVEGEDSKLDGDGTPDSTSSVSEPLMVGPFNLKDYNDWITIFLSSVIAWQSIGIVKEVIEGFTSKQ